MAKRVIMLGIDGFGLEGYQQAKTPNIDALFADGVISTTTRTVMPSVTMPNWTSHLTGGGPEQHGVFGNDWEKEDHSLDPQEMDEEGYYPSIFKMIVPWMIKGPGINNGVELKSPNSNANTSAVVSKLFGIHDTPESWIGRVPSGIFRRE